MKEMASVTATSDFLRSCLSCSKQMTCRLPGKSSKSTCERFVPFGSSGVINLDSLFKDKNKEPAENVSYGEEAELTELIDNALEESRNSVIPVDFTVDDRDLYSYPNLFEFVTDKQGLGGTLFPRQMWMFTKLLGEYCPRCSRTDFWDDIKNCPKKMRTLEDFREHAVFLEHGVCPECGTNKLELLRAGEMYGYHELAALLGQRSGKTLGTANLVPYIIHRLVKLRKPSVVYGLSPVQMLQCTFVGLTVSRATDLLWQPIRDLIRNSPWFRQLYEVLDYGGDKLGIKLYNDKDTFLVLDYHKIRMIPASPSHRYLRGATTVLTATDEFGWFMSGETGEGKERISAEGTYAALNNALTTVRVACARQWKKGNFDVPMGIGLYLSSPSSYFDKMSTIVRESEDSDTTLAVNLPTWEFNPDIEYKDLESNLRTLGHTAFWRDFGAIPPLSESGFIDDMVMVERCFSDKPNALAVKQTATHSLNNGIDRLKLEITRMDGIEAPEKARLLALDAGEVNNSFSGAVCHYEVVKENKETAKEMVKVVFDCIFEIIPSENEYAVSFTEVVRNVLYPVIEKMNVKAIVADRWSSAQFLDEASTDFGIHALTYSLKKSDFLSARSYMQAGLISFPKLEVSIDKAIEMAKESYPTCFTGKPCAHLAFQAMTVRETTKTVTKGVGLTDDSFRCVMLGVTEMLDDKLRNEVLIDTRVSNRKAGVVVTSVNMRGQSGSVSSNVVVLGRKS